MWLATGSKRAAEPPRHTVNRPRTVSSSANQSISCRRKGVHRKAHHAPDVLAAMKHICAADIVLFIADEVVTRWGRIDSLFSREPTEIWPRGRPLRSALLPSDNEGGRHILHLLCGDDSVLARRRQGRAVRIRRAVLQTAVGRGRTVALPAPGAEASASSTSKIEQ